MPLENPVGKGEIARYEQFPLFPHVFKRFGIGIFLLHVHTITTFKDLEIESF